MDRVPPDNYSQSDPASAAQYAPHHQELRAAAANNYAPAGTPTTDYSATPSSARSSHFPPEYLARQQHYTPVSAASMAQATSPSLPLSAGQNQSHASSESNKDPPIDPSIAASSPTYPGPYSPYPPQGHEMGQYPQHPPPGYPHWPGYPSHPHGMPYSSPGAPSAGGSPATTGPPRPGQVYSFVPIPGAQQHKRPRRRYEEIERMYKCGHNGCEKAYGTLNHLNAHVTMQGHGQKRTPEEFKEIRKEWKARKKEEEAARKAEEDRARQSMGGQPVDGNSNDSTSTPTSQVYPPGARPQLPPLAYSSGNQVPGQYPGGAEPMYQQGNNGQVYSTYPHSPYNQGGQVYQQHQ